MHSMYWVHGGNTLIYNVITQFIFASPQSHLLSPRSIVKRFRSSNIRFKLFQNPSNATNKLYVILLNIKGLIFKSIP